jgi:hypothetical protein
MTATDTTETTPTGAIEGIPLLDLTALTSPEELAAIESIRQVALVLVPRSLAGTLTAIPMEKVAAVVPVPDDADPRVQTGMVVMGGDALAPDDGEDAVLVVTGGLVLTSPVERVTYRQIVVTGMVLAPYGSESALGAGLTRVTGAVHYYDRVEGQDFKTLSGQATISADTLANEGGSPDDILIAAGQITVTGRVEELGFQRIFAAGQLLLPRDSERVLAPALSAEGQVVWYAGQPRFFTGNQRFDRAFLELLEEPTPLALVGRFAFGEDVTVELLRERVPAITLVGAISAPPELVPALQVLTVENYGRISAEQDDGDER